MAFKLNYPTQINKFHYEKESNYPAIQAAVEAVKPGFKYFERENFMFGWYPRAVFHDGSKLYLAGNSAFGNSLLTEEELFQDLYNTWRPVKQDEIDWFCANLTPEKYGR